MSSHIDPRAGSKMKEIRLLLIDNHPMVREGLALILNNQPDMRVVAQGATVSRQSTYTGNTGPMSRFST